MLPVYIYPLDATFFCGLRSLRYPAKTKTAHVFVEHPSEAWRQGSSRGGGSTRQGRGTDSKRRADNA